MTGRNIYTFVYLNKLDETSCHISRDEELVYVPSGRYFVGRTWEGKRWLWAKVDPILHGDCEWSWWTIFPAPWKPS